MPLLGYVPYELVGPPPDVRPYYADPSSIGYIPYCDPTALYYDPSSCDDMAESSPLDEPAASGIPRTSASGGAAQGQPRYTGQ